MKLIIRIILTIIIYFLLLHTLYSRVTVYQDHEEVALYGSLLCYSCIGVEQVDQRNNKQALVSKAMPDQQFNRDKWLFCFLCYLDHLSGQASCYLRSRPQLPFLSFSSFYLSSRSNSTLYFYGQLSFLCFRHNYYRRNNLWQNVLWIDMSLWLFTRFSL